MSSGRRPWLFRLYHGERLSVPEIAARSGVSRSRVYRVAARCEDVTAEIMRIVDRRDAKLVAESHGVPYVVFRMRVYRGWSLREAATTPVKHRGMLIRLTPKATCR